MKLYRKTTEFIDDSFKDERQKKHFERTVYWYEKFLPIPITETHRIAAYAHDVERAFRDESAKLPKNYLDSDFLAFHQNKGAEIISDFLRENNADEKMIENVARLVRVHEVGGDVEQDALMDADSVSYFEVNAELFVIQRASVQGYIKIKEKLDWMFGRIKSAKARKAAESNYKKWSAKLEKYK